MVDFMQRKHLSHSSVHDASYDVVRGDTTLTISGVGNVTINKIEKGAQIIKSGVGNLTIYGEVEGDVSFNISGVGSVIFSEMPPESVRNKIVQSGPAKVIFPQEYKAQKSNVVKQSVSSIYSNSSSSSSSSSSRSGNNKNIVNGDFTLEISGNNTTKVTINGESKVFKGTSSSFSGGRLFINDEEVTHPKIQSMDDSDKSKKSESNEYINDLDTDNLDSLKYQFSSHLEGDHLNLHLIALTDKNMQELLEYLNDNPGIISIDLTNCGITDNQLQMLASNRTLLKLSLGGNKFTSKGILALNACKNLQEIAIWNSAMTDECAIALASIPNLVKLVLNYNNIGNKGAIAIASHKKLTHVELEKNKITYEGAQAFAKNSLINRLILDKNPIGGNGCIVLASNKVLRSLSLGGCGVNDDIAKVIAQNTTLDEINLCVNQITQVGAEALVNTKNTNLTKLDIRVNKMESTYDDIYKQEINDLINRNKREKTRTSVTFFNAKSKLSSAVEVLNQILGVTCIANMRVSDGDYVLTPTQNIKVQELKSLLDEWIGIPAYSIYESYYDNSDQYEITIKSAGSEQLLKALRLADDSTNQNKKSEEKKAEEKIGKKVEKKDDGDVNMKANDKITSNSDINSFSKFMQDYIDGFKGKTPYSQTVQELNLTNDEEETLSLFSDPIYLTLMDVPILLNGNRYNLKTLLDLPKKMDPLANYEFTLRDIQPDRKTNDEIKNAIAAIQKGRENNNVRRMSVS